MSRFYFEQMYLSNYYSHVFMVYLGILDTEREGHHLPLCVSKFMLMPSNSRSKIIIFVLLCWLCTTSKLCIGRSKSIFPIHTQKNTVSWYVHFFFSFVFLIPLLYDHQFNFRAKLFSRFYHVRAFSLTARKHFGSTPIWKFADQTQGESVHLC